MARVIYKPEGVEPRTFQFTPDDMQSNVLEDIEDVTGWTAAEWATKLGRGSIKAMRVFLWVNLRETVPDLDPASVRFTMQEIEILPDLASEGEADPKDSPSGSAGPGTGGSS